MFNERNLSELQLPSPVNKKSFHQLYFDPSRRTPQVSQTIFCIRSAHASSSTCVHLHSHPLLTCTALVHSCYSVRSLCRCQLLWDIHTFSAASSPRFHSKSSSPATFPSRTTYHGLQQYNTQCSASLLPEPHFTITCHKIRGFTPLRRPERRVTRRPLHLLVQVTPQLRRAEHRARALTALEFSYLTHRGALEEAACGRLHYRAAVVGARLDAGVELHAVR